MYKILVIDDEIEIGNLIKLGLEKNGYDVFIKTTSLGIELDYYNKFDLIILDVMMPNEDGFSICRRIRKDVDVPILFLTAKSMEKDIVEGLAIGADDYIKKPFSLAELRARVAAHIRRENREKHQVLKIDNIRFDLSSKEISIDESLINFTKTEYEICELLAFNRGQVFSLERILEKVLGYNTEADISTIRVHIKNIRDKFKNQDLNPIKTIWGVGYKWG